MHIYLTGFICYNTKRFAAVAQLDRVPDSDSGGRGFESRQPYHENHRFLRGIGGFLYFLPPLEILYADDYQQILNFASNFSRFARL